jgi:hypothetical protein
MPGILREYGKLHKEGNMTKDELKKTFGPKAIGRVVRVDDPVRFA